MNHHQDDAINDIRVKFRKFQRAQEELDASLINARKIDVTYAKIGEVIKMGDSGVRKYIKRIGEDEEDTD